jgi:hypothetical protein
MQITNKFNVPLSLAIWLAHSDYDFQPESKTISATSLLKPIKSIVLSMYTQSASPTDVMDLVASSLGTAIHTAIEEAWKSESLKGTLEALGHPKKIVDGIVINPTPEQLVEGAIPIYMEIRRTKQIDGWNISGKFDFISNGMLEDFKSTGTYNYMSQSNSQKYIQQASIYRWLNQDLVTQDTFAINYIFTDWSSVKAKQETDYPKSRLLQQKFELMSVPETEQFIKEKIRQINKYLTVPEQLPDCTPEELWMKPSVFKYYKNPEKMDRSTKNFDSYWEANQRMTEDGSVGKVVEVKGEAVFCRYCAASATCTQAAKLIQEGRLIL